MGVRCVGFTIQSERLCLDSRDSPHGGRAGLSHSCPVLEQGRVGVSRVLRDAPVRKWLNEDGAGSRLRLRQVAESRSHADVPRVP